MKMTDYLKWKGFQMIFCIDYHPKTQRKTIIILFLSILLMPLLLPFALRPVEASEGGSSGYGPGTYGDFAMNVGFPGLTIREYILYLYGTLDNHPLLYTPAIAVEADLEVEAWVDLIQAAWFPEDVKIFNGDYFIGISIPYAFNVDFEGTVGPLSEKESTEGLGDIQIVPLGVIWNKDYFHFSLAESITAPSGQYDKTQVVNVGRNYWGFETVLGFTWLEEKRGHEVSFTACYTFNTENKDTDYQTGDEFHLDYTLAQFFSQELAAGAVGYIYRQTTDDSGSGYDTLSNMLGKDLNGYKSKGAGIGPAVMWSPKLGGTPLGLVAKWLYEYEGTNRLKGGWVFVSAALTF